MNHHATQLPTTVQDDSNVIDPALLNVDHPSSGIYDRITPQLWHPSSELPPAIVAELDLYHSHNAVSESGRSGDHLLSAPFQMSTVAPNSQQPDELSESPMDRQRSVRATHPIADPSTISHGRQLPRRRSRYLTRHLNAQAGPIMIPNASSDLNPMERWRNSPPEEEPALIPDIIDALKMVPSQPDSISRDAPGGNSHAFRHYRRAASTTSGESSASSRDSQHSGRSTSSAQDPLGVQGQGSRVRKGKAPSRQRPTTTTHRTTSSTHALRRYCCTFCCDRFKSKYDWARHEKSLHVTLEAWYCAPFGTTILSATAPETTLCAFCGALDPDIAHLNAHDAAACETAPGTRRSFRRKDHLMQHLRLVHHITPGGGGGGGGPPHLESWKISEPAITSRCGFCDTRLHSWEARVEHLAEHFRTGRERGRLV